jgi:hypothetical protein
MNYVYYIDGKKFTTDERRNVPDDYVSSPNENTPAYENLENGFKVWCKKGWQFHRLTGVALIRADKSKHFYLNGKYYENVKEWINDHPNPDMYFDALGMNETDKILWFLKN